MFQRREKSLPLPQIKIKFLGCQAIAQWLLYEICSHCHPPTSRTLIFYNTLSHLKIQKHLIYCSYMYSVTGDMKEHKKERYHSAQDHNMPITFKNWWHNASKIDLYEVVIMMMMMMQAFRPNTLRCKTQTNLLVLCTRCDSSDTGRSVCFAVMNTAILL